MKTRIVAASLLAALVLAACSRHERVREIDWAKSALARNPAYEIVATDETAGVFTVKDTTTGEISTLRVDDLVAAPAPPREATAARSTPPTAATPPATEPAPALAADQTTDAANDLAEPTEEVVATPSATGTPIVEGPGYSISRGDARSPAAAATTLEGPGYSIVREEPTARPSARRAEVAAANGSVVRRSDPIICQGERLLRIDGETLEFSGDAVIAEEGCDLYISNARIQAGGVGLIARQARVHIVNSTITGSGGSYEASQGAEVYASSTTFTGIGRRFDSAKVTDLGGNNFRSH